MAQRTGLFLFITRDGANVWSESGGYFYKDDVYYENGTVCVEFASQKRWKLNDVKLMAADENTFIFLRESNKEPFRFLGRVRERQVRAPRTDSDPLLMKFTMDTQATSWCTRNQVFPPVPFRGMGKYKLGVYDATGAVPVKGDGIVSGIVPVRFVR